jgi:pimeloyl-ACP methyl ester carboxylesterase
LAKFTLDVLDALKLQKVAIGGNSLGGEVAWRVATLAPQRVERLILVDSSGTNFESESTGLGFLIARIPGINSVFETILPRALVAQTVVSVYGDPGKVTAELVDRYYELLLRSGNRRALGQRLQQLERGAHVSKIAQLTLPTLILWGGRDKLIPRKVGHEFQRLIARSELLVYEELGHVPQEEDPALTVVAVKGFLGL